MAAEDRGGSPAADVTFDFGREARLGFAEAVLCLGKTATQIDRILEEVEGRLQALLLTRLGPETLGALSARHRDLIDYEPVSRTGIFGTPRTVAGPARVAVVSAGTSDLPVAREAVRTLGFHGAAATEVHDVGVAGLWRLLAREQELKRHAVVIVCAGMDGALFSVAGGLLPGVVIAVPTSTGYGAARRGETALHAALTSCAPGLLVSNIDNGYGAAAAALRILHQLG